MKRGRMQTTSSPVSRPTASSASSASPLLRAYRSPFVRAPSSGHRIWFPKPKTRRELASTNLVAPAAAARRARRSLPSTLTLWSCCQSSSLVSFGSSRTSPPRWKTVSTPATARSRSPSSTRLPRWISPPRSSRWSVRLDSRASARTDVPRSTSESTRWRPRQPVAPVTRARSGVLTGASRPTSPRASSPGSIHRARCPRSDGRATAASSRRRTPSRPSGNGRGEADRWSRSAPSARRRGGGHGSTDCDGATCSRARTSRCRRSRESSIPRRARSDNPPALLDTGFDDLVRRQSAVVADQERRRDGTRERHERGDDERGLEAVDEGRPEARIDRLERVDLPRDDGAEHRNPERAAQLPKAVEHPGADSCFLHRHRTQNGDRHGRHREADAHPADDEARDRVPETRSDVEAREEKQCNAD